MIKSESRNRGSCTHGRHSSHQRRHGLRECETMKPTVACRRVQQLFNTCHILPLRCSRHHHASRAAGSTPIDYQHADSSNKSLRWLVACRYTNIRSLQENLVEAVVFHAVFEPTKPNNHPATRSTSYAHLSCLPARKRGCYPDLNTWARICMDTTW